MQLVGVEVTDKKKVETSIAGCIVLTLYRRLLSKLYVSW